MKSVYQSVSCLIVAPVNLCASSDQGSTIESISSHPGLGTFLKYGDRPDATFLYLLRLSYLIGNCRIRKPRSIVTWPPQKIPSHQNKNQQNETIHFRICHSTII